MVRSRSSETTMSTKRERASFLGVRNTLVPGDTLTSRCRLRQLQVNQFRNVKQKTVVHFDNGLNVILGHNGTGKTTLLELICALASGDLGAYQEEVFDIEFEVEVGTLIFRVWAQNASTKVVSGQSFDWRYEIEVLELGRRVLFAHVSPMGVQSLDGSSQDSTIHDREVDLFQSGFFIRHLMNAGWEERAASLFNSNIQFYARGVHSCLRLDEGLDLFRAVMEGDPLPRIGRPFNISVSSSEYVGEMKLQNSVLVEDRIVRTLLNQAQTVYAPVSVVGQLSTMNDIHSRVEVGLEEKEHGFLQQAARALYAKDVQCALKLVRRERGDGEGASRSIFGRPSFWITTDKGVTYVHDQLSYGEKRLLAFLWHAAANPEILVSDELVNGLHYDWIQTCLDAIQGQAFLTSQNPLLLDHLPFEAAEEVQRRFVLCDRNDDGDWTWRNMSQESADAFYRAYEVGIQHVSEILRTKGMW